MQKQIYAQGRQGEVGGDLKYKYKYKHKYKYKNKSMLRADKEKLGEISKEDWFETLTAAGLNVNMYVLNF